MSEIQSEETSTDKYFIVRYNSWQYDYYEEPLGAIIFTWYWMHEKNKNTIIQHTTGDSYDVIARNHEELKKFVETINMMR